MKRGTKVESIFMYRDYIDGKKEIAEINAEFNTDYIEAKML